LYEKDVENATNSYGNEPDWGKVVELCGRIQNSVGSTALKGALMAIMMRAKHPEERIKLQAVALLESCVTNCGKEFRAEMCDQQILNDLRDLAKGVGCSNTVSNRMKSLLASWSSEFGNESSFSGVCQLKTSLQTQGISFPAVRSTAMPSVRSSSHQQEDSDLKRAIELSLQDQSSRSQPATSSSVYPSLTTSHPIKHPSKSSGKKCRALFDFTAAEDNELSFKTGEVIEILDDRDKHWWKGKSPVGEGLFPSNFVTLDLSTDPSAKKNEDIKRAKERARLASASSKPKQINMEVIDVCLDMLRSADTTCSNKEENATLKEMESQCKAMRPIVEKKLLEIEGQVGQLQQLNEEYQQAIVFYRQLLTSGVLPSQPQVPAMSIGQVYNSGTGIPSGDIHSMAPQQSWQQQVLGHPSTVSAQDYAYQPNLTNQLVFISVSFLP
jgi:signal transducing adaptor molecule